MSWEESHEAPTDNQYGAPEDQGWGDQEAGAAQNGGWPDTADDYGAGAQNGNGNGGGWPDTGGDDYGGGPKYDNLNDESAFENLKPIDWDNEQIEEANHNDYQASASIRDMSEQEVATWREANQMTVDGNDCPRPIRVFEESRLPEDIIENLKTAGFKAPTPIQMQCWPMIMTGQDVIGVAQTGSGKTLGFMLPGIMHVRCQTSGSGPIILCVAPTRELASQILQEIMRFGSSQQNQLRCAGVWGGVSKRIQIQELRRNPQVLVGTPGRLLDFLNNGDTHLKRVTYMILDEADRMLDMGFKPQIKRIFSQIRPRGRQVLMFSATWPRGVEQLAQEFFTNNTLKVTIGSLETSANHNVEQRIEFISGFWDKKQRLVSLIKEYSTTKMLIFMKTKRSCDDMEHELTSQDFWAEAIHGDKEQHQRDSIIRNFKNNKIQCLIATDVASRGIHVDDVGMVINFDFPGDIETYVHRIGRTGRCGKSGISISFFDRSQDSARAAQLIDVLMEAQQPVPQDLYEMRGGGGGGSSRSYGRRRGRGGMRGGGGGRSGGWRGGSGGWM